MHADAVSALQSFPAASACRLTARYSSPIVTYWWFAVNLAFGTFGEKHYWPDKRQQSCSRLQVWKRKEGLTCKCRDHCLAITLLRAFLRVFWATDRTPSVPSSCVNTGLISIWTWTNVDTQPVWGGEGPRVMAPSARVCSAVRCIQRSCSNDRLQIYVREVKRWCTAEL